MFGRALGGELVYDDLLLIGANPALTSLGRIPEAFSSAYWDFLEPAAANGIGYWRPLTAVALTLTHALGEGGVTAFHGLSLILHAISALLLWRLAVAFFALRPLPASFTSGANAPQVFPGGGLLPLLAALIFALHPVQVESVAWISAVNGPLSGALGLAMLLAHLAWRRSGTQGIPYLPALCFAAALLAKEQALALPLVLVALDYATTTEGESARSRLARTYLPLLAILALYYCARCLVFASPLAGFDRLTSHFGLGTQRLLELRFELFGGFLGLLAWPFDLNLFRPFRPVIPAGDGTWLAALLACAAWLLAFLTARRRRARTSAGLLLLLPAALAPVIIAVNSVGQFPLSERFLYLAVAGLALLVTDFAARHLPRRLALALLSFVALACGLRSHLRLPAWENEEALFRAAVAANMESPYAHWGLGRVMLDRYRETGHRPFLDEAQLEFLISLSGGWDYGPHTVDLDGRRPLEERLDEMSQLVGAPPADRHRDDSVLVTVNDRLQANLGQAWCHLYLDALPENGGDMNRSRAVFKAVLAAFPESFEAHTGLGCVELASAELSEAIACFDRALALHPDYAEAHHNRGQALARAGQHREAAQAFLAAAARRPGQAQDLIAAARALLEAGAATHLEQAGQIIAQAQTLAPGDHQVLGLKSLQLASSGDLVSALVWSTRSLEALGASGIDGNRGAGRPSRPSRPSRQRGEAQLHHGKLLLALDRKADAVRALKEACRQLPDSFEAHYNLGVLVMGGGDRQAAMPFLVRAYGLRQHAPQNDAGAASLSGLNAALSEFAGQDANLAAALARQDEDAGQLQAALAWIELGLARRRAELAAAEEEAPAGVEAPGATRLRLRSLASDDSALRARLALRSGRTQEGRAALEKALAWTPDHFQSHHDLGILLAQSADPAARPHLERALELLPAQQLPEKLRASVRAGLEAALASGGD
ncbi:MAG: tetratricopeptide repeat protein [Planctomycetota bacterium]|nr:tetratricopeptide repeat protein [Planctomycetota bacterium]